MRPVSEVENDGLLGFVQILCPAYQMPGRKSIANKVKAKCNEVINKVESITQKARYTSIQMDIWSSRRMHGFLGICISYILNAELHTRLISCKRFPGAHTADKIAEAYSTAIKKFTTPQNVTAIITDNASNMVKAFPDGVQLQAAPSDSTDVSNDDADNEDDDLQRVPIDWDTVDDEASCILPGRYGCMAHSLQLVVKDGLGQAAAKVSHTLAKCTSFVGSIHKSCKATEVLEAEVHCQIPSPNATRWNSQLAMINAILSIEEKHPGVLKNVSDHMASKVLLSGADFVLLQELQQLLAPFATATVQLQSETYVTSSHVLPIIIGLKSSTERLSLRYCSSVQAGLLNSHEKRFKDIYKDPHFIVSTVLDPKFKLRWALTSEESTFARETVLDKCKTVILDRPHSLNDESMSSSAALLNETTGSCTTSSTHSAETVYEENMLFSFMTGQENAVRNHQISLAAELDSYLLAVAHDVNALVYWNTVQKTFPTLYQLHLRHHCVPATSAAIERVFSAAGYIACARRNRLTDEFLELLLLAKCNKDLL